MNHFTEPTEREIETAKMIRRNIIVEAVSAVIAIPIYAALLWLIVFAF